MAQDVTGLWNSNAATYNFETTFEAALGADFNQTYKGSNFSTDFFNILTAIDKVARPDSEHVPGLGGDDPMLASLQNYPDNP